MNVPIDYVINNHKSFDPLFEEFARGLKNGEIFTAEPYEEEDWEQRFEDVGRLLDDPVPADAHGNKKRGYLNHLMAAENPSAWYDVEKYDFYVEIFSRAHKAGFLLDCTLQSGPSPTEKWTTLATPKKIKRKVTTSSTGSSLQVSLPMAHLPPSSPVSASPLAPTTVPAPASNPAPALNTGPQDFPGGVPLPSSESVSHAYMSFMAGDKHGSSLPMSKNAGTSPTISATPATPASTLPIMIRDTVDWAAPANQEVYELADWMPPHIPRKTKGVNSPIDWVVSVHTLARSMSRDPSSHQFTWVDFSSYFEVTLTLFELYEFAAVKKYDREWRAWRRAGSLPWSTKNAMLRDVHLTGRNINHNKGDATQPTPKPPRAPGTATGVCNDFSKPNFKCPRLASCTYTHKCKRCNTTWPRTTDVCPCVAGVMPPGTQYPSGVQFGQ